MASPASHTTSHFRVLLLGPFALYRDGALVDTSAWQRRVGSLFKLLATAPEQRRLRDELIDILWPDASPDAGAGNLRIVAYRLRRALTHGMPHLEAAPSSSPVLSEQGWVALNPAYSWEVDLHHLEALARAAGSDIAALERAAVLYRGEPLPEDRYEDWAIPVRERAQRTWREVCLRLAVLHGEGGAHEEAARRLEQVLEADPLDEEALRALLTVLYRAGRRADALRRYHHFEQRLAEEIGVPPSAETMEVVQRLHAQFAETETPWAAPQSAERGAVRYLPIGGFLGALPDGPLIGREEELERILFVADVVEAGTGRLVLLTGERGVGKTRLAQEVSLRLRDRGLVAATGRCYERQQATALSPFREALALAYEALPPAVRVEMAKRWTPLTRLLPEQMPLLAQAGASAAPSPSRSQTDLATLDSREQQRLFPAVAGFLTDLAAERPVALLLDDLQWADAASLNLFEHLAHQTRGARILLLGTYRDADVDREGPLGRLVRDLDREGLVERVAVRRLSLDATAALVDATIGEMEGSREFAEFVYRRTKGNPFFVEKMVQALGGRYCLVRQIGMGGMGRVFEAVDTRTGNVVAAKIMFARTEADPKALPRFKQEGEMLASIDHPNIVKIYGIFLEEYANCIVMELLEGQSLGRLIRSMHPGEERESRPPGRAATLPLERIKRLTEQVASALACAHEHGIVHRDIKPDNIMVTEDDQVKVTDFGIARLVRPKDALTSLTSTGMTLGTPLYMAPEQIEGGKVDGRADIYSLGAVLYQLVTGQPLFEGEDPLSIAFKHVHVAPTPPSQVNADIPDDWEAMILKALAKDPADRPQSAEMERAIAALSTKRAARALPLSVLPAQQPAMVSPQGLSLQAGSQRDEAGNRAGAIVVRQPDYGERASALQASAAATRARPWWTRRVLWASGLTVVLAAVAAAVFLFTPPSRHTAARSATRPPVTAGSASGSGAGQFEGPTGASIDAQGHIYVADQGNNRIQEFSAQGIPLAHFGTHGTGPDQFNGPTDVAVDTQGNVLVADYGNDRVEILSPSGASLETINHWSRKGQQPAGFDTLNSVAVDGHNEVYATDLWHDRIEKFTENNDLLAQWGRPGIRLARFRTPTTIRLDAQGNIYVVDRDNNRIEKFSPAGKPLLQWGTLGSGKGQFRRPQGLAVDSRGNVWVADTGNNRIQEFSSQGAFITQLGTSGTGPGQFRQPSGVAVDREGNIYVSDYYNNRLQKLSPAGVPLWGTHGLHPGWGRRP